MKSMGTGILCGMVAYSLVLAPAGAQTPASATPAASSELQTGPATIPAHWSRYKYPETIPEGATYYIIKRGDTLWDLAGKFLGNPFLWPQIWEDRKSVV